MSTKDRVSSANLSNWPAAPGFLAVMTTQLRQEYSLSEV